MNTVTGEEPVLGKALWTYAKGLTYMAATGLGAFGIFCFYVSALDRRLSAVEISTVVGTLAVVLFVWCIGRSDKARSRERELTSLTLWVFYLLLCAHLICPVLQKPKEDATTQLFVLAATIIVTLPVLWYFLLRRMIKAAGGETGGRTDGKKDVWYPSGGAKETGQDKVAGPDITT